MSRILYSAIRSEGGLLPGDLLSRIAAGSAGKRDKKLPGLDEASYGLLAHESLGEAINRAWSRLLGAWRGFREASRRLPEHDRGTTLTRERWLLPLFYELGFGRLLTAKALELPGRSLAVSHGWQHSPIHLVSVRLDLDKRLPGVAGAAAASPHGLLQELLNHSSDRLWGFLSNGRSLRILRDHHSLTGKAYLEFDLEQIFEGDLYSEFRLMWLVCHSSRVQAEKPEDCLLERWFQSVKEDGVQALEALRGGVETALVALGEGFLRHPRNRRLREALSDGTLNTQDYYRQLLRLIYRLIFLFVAEDRGALLDPLASEAARDRYQRFYSSRRLRTLADKKRGGPHPDLWIQLRTVLNQLYEGCPGLALPALGSFLWSPQATPDLNWLELSNQHLLAALRALTSLEHEGVRRPVAWHLLSADELGGIYESLMELHPIIHKEADRDGFQLQTAPGHERKTTGSYYTPSILVQSLLGSALDPVLERAERAGDPEAAILELKVVDPACGSGHFLVAAARRMADRLARVRTGDLEPAPPDYLRALRDVVGRCIFGVDLNEMAVELCKVALWMEALEPGKPLSFLDAHIQQGNALLGAMPKLLASGIPDDAWTPITGDDPAVARLLKKRNRDEHKRQLGLFDLPSREDGASLQAIAHDALGVEAAPDVDLSAIRAKEGAWRRLEASPVLKDARFVADVWCSAFVWPKDETHLDSAPTQDLFKRVSRDVATCPASTRQAVRRLAHQYRFFHWHLAFPSVFRRERGSPQEASGWVGGFDVVLGNPPWERIKLQEKEYFATRAPDIAAAVNASARKKAILRLEREQPLLWADWMEAQHMAEGESTLVRDSQRYPLCGQGDINTYALFAELNRSLLTGNGRAGFITPTGIATDASTSDFLAALVNAGHLAGLRSFQDFGTTFGSVNNRQSFCLVSLSATSVEAMQLEFITNQALPPDAGPTDFSLTPADFKLLNPNTLTCPVFRTRRDAEISKHIYRHNPVLWRDDDPAGNRWRITFKRMLDMATDSGLFRTREQLEGEGWRLEGNRFVKGSSTFLPLYEAKMVHHFDHRFAGVWEGDPGPRESRKFEGWYGVIPTDPHDLPIPRYWVSEPEVLSRLPVHLPEPLLELYHSRDTLPDPHTLSITLLTWLAGDALMHEGPLHPQGWLQSIAHRAIKTQKLENQLRDDAQRWAQDFPLTAADRHLLEPLCQRAEQLWAQQQSFLTLQDGLEPYSWLERLVDAHRPHWMLGWRDICRSTDTRTVIAGIIPRYGTGNTSPLAFFSIQPGMWGVVLSALFSSFALDYCARQKVGGTHLTYNYMKQLAIPGPERFLAPCSWHPGLSVAAWLRPRILELTYTAWDMEPFARDVLEHACGYGRELPKEDGLSSYFQQHCGATAPSLLSSGSLPPFQWNEERRFLLRAELDAAFFHAYGSPRADVAYILETFPLVKARDEKEYGTYRTRDTILLCYDAMAAAVEAGTVYQTLLNPLPADASVAHSVPVRRRHLALVVPRVSEVEPSPLAVPEAPATSQVTVVETPDLPQLPAGALAVASSATQMLSAFGAAMRAMGGVAQDRPLRLLVCLILRPDLAAPFLPDADQAHWWRALGMVPGQVLESISLKDWAQTRDRLLAHDGLVRLEEAEMLTWRLGDWLNDKLNDKPTVLALERRAAILGPVVRRMSEYEIPEEIRHLVAV